MITHHFNTIRRVCLADSSADRLTEGLSCQSVTDFVVTLSDEEALDGVKETRETGGELCPFSGWMDDLQFTLKVFTLQSAASALCLSAPPSHVTKHGLH